MVVEAYYRKRGKRRVALMLPWAHVFLNRHRAATLGLLTGLVVLYGGSVSPARASAGPGWAIKSVSLPTNFLTGDDEVCEKQERCDGYLVTAVNVGTRSSAGMVVLKDTLPAGLVVEGVVRKEEREPGGGASGEPLSCPEEEPGASAVKCEYANPVPPGGVLEMFVEVKIVGESKASVTNHAEVEGGEAADVVSSEPTTVANVINGEAAGLRRSRLQRRSVRAQRRERRPGGGSPRAVRLRSTTRPSHFTGPDGSRRLLAARKRRPRSSTCRLVFSAIHWPRDNAPSPSSLAQYNTLAVARLTAWWGRSLGKSQEKPQVLTSITLSRKRAILRSSGSNTSKPCLMRPGSCPPLRGTP